MLNRIIYPYIRRKKDLLKRRVNARGPGVWMGSRPKVLAQSDLLIGDVIFCGSAKSDKATTLIQNMTDGAYVHCGIYTGNGKVTDISTSGARKILLSDFREDYTYLAIARCPGMNTLRRRAIIRYANLCVKNKVNYNWLGAALLPLNEYFYIKQLYWLAFGKRYKKQKIERKYITKYRMFCSEFVVQCYKSCGYIKKTESSHKISPTWLAEENTFSLVGYMSSSGLMAVDDKDPFVGGCSHVLRKT